jgi:hypothetical protein
VIININNKGPVEFFTWEEVANNKSRKAIKLEIEDWDAFMEHAEMMNELRVWAVAAYPEIFKKGLTASSWYRDPEYNAEMKPRGASNSAHLDARATDINNIPESLYDSFRVAWWVICTRHNKIGGIELYDWGMHFDSHSDKFGSTKFRLKDNR